MMPDSFTTRPLRTRDQFEAWRAWYQPVFDLTPKHPAAGGFSAEINLWTLGGMAITRTIAPPADIMRAREATSGTSPSITGLSATVRAAHIRPLLRV